MTTQFLRDEKGRTIGMIASTANCVLVLRNANGQSLGTDAPERDVTIDSKGRAVGTGNLITTLLRSCSSKNVNHQIKNNEY